MAWRDESGNTLATGGRTNQQNYERFNKLQTKQQKGWSTTPGRIAPTNSFQDARLSTAPKEPQPATYSGAGNEILGKDQYGNDFDTSHLVGSGGSSGGSSAGGSDDSGLVAPDQTPETPAKPRPTSGWGGEDLGNDFVSRPSFAAQAFMPDQNGIYDYEKQALRKWYEDNFPDEVAKGSPYTAQMALANIDSPEAWDAILAMAGDLAYDTNPWAREAVIRAVSNTYKDNVPGAGLPGFFDPSTGHYNMDTMSDIYDYDQATRPTLESVLRGGKEKWVEGVGSTPTVFGDDMAQTLAYFGLGFPGMSQTEAYELLANDPNAFYEAMPSAVTSNWVELQDASPYLGRSMEDWERGRQEFRGDDVVPNDFLDPSVQGFTPSTFSVEDMVKKIKSGSSGASQGEQPAASTEQSNGAPAASASASSAASDQAAQRIQELVSSGVTDVNRVISILEDEGIYPGPTKFPGLWSMYGSY